ncbi:MAG: sugar phosphate isomerase/epimerase [Eubacteriales bacterium]|nr:sugar phosphate isomerase/epimerase [Eubacteriales bacterium]MDD3881432.1 sugar phosphate isomerase/epimerase [Eubacteriales bacterium]
MKLSVFFHHIMEGAKQRGITLAEALEYAHECGIDYVEADLRELQEIGDGAYPLISGSGLKLGAVNGFFDFAHKDETAGIIRFLDTAADFGAKLAMAIPGFIECGEDKNAAREKMAEALRFCVNEARARSLRLVLEDFDSDKALYGSIEDLKWFMDSVPDLGCAFDTGNFIYHADDALKAYDVFRGNIAHVHLKDRAEDARYGASPLRCVDGRVLYPAYVGSGIIPIAKILDRLFEDGYDGICAIEHFGAADQLEAMRVSAEWLRAYEGEKVKGVL